MAKRAADIAAAAANAARVLLLSVCTGQSFAVVRQGE
jgi:hypothetical protein